MTLRPPIDGREPWDALASGYDEHVTPTNRRLGERVLDLAGLEPGERFLDVAAGSGALSLPAARRGARVLATDIAPRMLERLAERARQEGLTGIETRVADGQALGLEDAGFDLAGSQFGVMLFPDLPRGLREMARATRPGGRVVVVVFGPPQRFEVLAFALRAIRAADPGFAGLPGDPPLPFQAADPAVLRRRLEEAGLRDVRVETLTDELEFASAPALWRWFTSSNPLGTLLAGRLDGARREAALQALEGLLRERAGGDGPAVLRSLVHVGIGTA